MKTAFPQSEEGCFYAHMLLQQNFMTQVDSALIVDLHYFDLQLIANLDNILYLLNPMVSQLRNVAQAFFARQDFNKGTELHKTRYLAVVDLTDLDLTDDVFDHLLGAFHEVAAIGQFHQWIHSAESLQLPIL